MTHFCRFYGKMFYNLGQQYLISAGVHARDNSGKVETFLCKAVNHVVVQEANNNT